MGGLRIIFKKGGGKIIFKKKEKVKVNWERNEIIKINKKQQKGKKKWEKVGGRGFSQVFSIQGSIGLIPNITWPNRKTGLFTSTLGESRLANLASTFYCARFILFKYLDVGEKKKMSLSTSLNSDFCCVPQCAVSGKFNFTVSFHHFPKDETVRRIWIHNVRRDNLVIKRTTTVFSRHFVSEDVIQDGRRRLKEGAVPVLFAWNSTGSQTKCLQENTTTRGWIHWRGRDGCWIDASVPWLWCKTTTIIFGLERFSSSDDDIRFYTRYVSCHLILSLHVVMT